MTDSALPVRLSLAEAATRFRVCPRTISYWINEEKLDTLTISRRRFVLLTPRTLAFEQQRADPDFYSPLL